MTGNFIQKLYNTEGKEMTDEEISAMMNFPDMKRADIFNDCVEIIKKYLKININYIRHSLKNIGEFSSSTHSMYKRFKHACMPIMPSRPVRIVIQSKSFLDQYEIINVISNGKDPLNDITLIPFSVNLFEKYKQLANDLQVILKLMICNRIICIERKMSGVFPENKLTDDRFSDHELIIIGQKINEYNNIHKKRTDIPKDLNINIGKDKYEEIRQNPTWYSNNLP